MSDFRRQCNYLRHPLTQLTLLAQKIPFINFEKVIFGCRQCAHKISIQQGLVGLWLGLVLGSVQFNWFVVVLWTIMWCHLLNQLVISGDIVLWRKKQPEKLDTQRFSGKPSRIFGDITLLPKKLSLKIGDIALWRKNHPRNSGTQPFSEKPSLIFGDIASFKSNTEYKR